MKQINRSEFLETTATNILAGEPVLSQPFKEFYNKKLPTFDSRSRSGLTAYTGTFGTGELAHLLRRTLFGVTKADMDHFNGKTLNQVVTELLTASPTPTPPLNAYSMTDPDVAFGQTWVNAPFTTDGTINAQRRFSLKQWWVSLMINQDRSITEKMTLFWHNHFSTETSIIQDSRYAYKHHAMLRANALGNFKTLTRAVTTDPAMLVYLNGDTNTKGAPNENYGRELQELFTVGKGPDSLYTQADVEAAAKVLTGWRDNRTTNPVASFFDSTKHDTTDKQFSAFYNNTIITGQTGANGANETDQLIDMIFNQHETAKFMSRKLYRWFIYYVIDQQVEDDIISPLADIMVNNNYDMVPVLAALFQSEHFFDTLNRGCHIKNPADHMIGMCRQFNLGFPDTSDLSLQYAAWNAIYGALALNTMDIGDPPNVAGWPAYYQEPAYHELWINSNTLPNRKSITDGLVYTDFNKAKGIKITSKVVNTSGNSAYLLFDLIAFAKQSTAPGDPNQLIADSVALLSPNPLEQSDLDALKSALLSGQTSDHYWTDAWDAYIGAPGNTTYMQTVYTRLMLMYDYLLDLAEHQLI